MVDEETSGWEDTGLVMGDDVFGSGIEQAGVLRGLHKRSMLHVAAWLNQCIEYDEPRPIFKGETSRGPPGYGRIRLYKKAYSDTSCVRIHGHRIVM